MVRVAFPELKGIHVMGRARVRLRATSDQRSTHFVAVLLDVAAGRHGQGDLTRPPQRALPPRAPRGVDLDPGKPDRLRDRARRQGPHRRRRSPRRAAARLVEHAWVLPRRAPREQHAAPGSSELELPIDGPARRARSSVRPVAATPPRERRSDGEEKPCTRRAVLRLPARIQRRASTRQRAPRQAPDRPPARHHRQAPAHTYRPRHRPRDPARARPPPHRHAPRAHLPR